MGSENNLCWNVRGLNAGSHRDTVQELVRVERISLVCLQESKMNVITNFDVLQILGPGFDYFFSPLHVPEVAFWLFGVLRLGLSPTPHHGASRCRSGCKRHWGGGGWWLSTVYRTTTDVNKPTFSEEIHELSQVRSRRWALCGDFNMIYRAQDKNNDHLDRKRMG
jgi:hypothetical protein